METKQTVESEQATESVIDEKKNTTDVDEEADASDEVPRVDEATESAIQHQFNELRREYLVLSQVYLDS